MIVLKKIMKNKMEGYMQILTVKGAGEFNAGPKAPSDIIEILTKKYNAKSVLLVQGRSILEKIKYRIKIFSTIRK